jgi:hypothetical protein
MSCDEQLAGSAGSEQFDPHKNRCDDGGMYAVERDCVNRMETRERLAIGTTEGDISA